MDDVLCMQDKSAMSTSQDISGGTDHGHLAMKLQQQTDPAIVKAESDTAPVPQARQSRGTRKISPATNTTHLGKSPSSLAIRQKSQDKPSGRITAKKCFIERVVKAPNPSKKTSPGTTSETYPRSIQKHVQKPHAPDKERPRTIPSTYSHNNPREFDVLPHTTSRTCSELTQKHFHELDTKEDKPLRRNSTNDQPIQRDSPELVPIKEEVDADRTPIELVIDDLELVSDDLVTDDLENENKKLAENIDKFNKMEEKMAKLEAGKSELHVEIKDLQKQIKEKDEKIKTLEDILEKMKREHIEQQKSNALTIEELSERNRELKLKLSQSETKREEERVRRAQEDTQRQEQEESKRGAQERSARHNIEEKEKMKAQIARQDLDIQKLERWNRQLENASQSTLARGAPRK